MARPDPLPDQLREDMEQLGRLMNLLNLRLSRGTVASDVDVSTEVLVNLGNRIRIALRELPDTTLIHVNTNYGEDTATLIAEALAPVGVPDNLAELDRPRLREEYVARLYDSVTGKGLGVATDDQVYASTFEPDGHIFINSAGIVVKVRPSEGTDGLRRVYVQ